MGDGHIYAMEVADAVETDSLGYDIQGVRVSDFVTPSYFEPWRNGARYDFMGHLRAPCPALMPGGYMSVYNPWFRHWGQVTSRNTRADLIAANPPLGSRRWRRNLPFDERLASTRFEK